MYCVKNFRTKKELKKAVESGEEVRLFQPGGIFNPPENSPNYTGWASVEGPHFPQPHTWYASVWVENGLVRKVK